MATSSLKLALINVNGAYYPQHEPFDFLHRQFDTIEDALILAERYQRRRDRHREWHTREAMLWEGQDAKRTALALAQMPRLPGAEALVGALREAGVALALFSDGFNLQVEPLAEAIGARFVFANTLFVEGDALTGEIDLTFDPAQKGALAGEALAALGATPEECIALGCTLSDVQLFEQAGWSAAIAAYDERVNAAATVAAPEPDLRPLLAMVQRRIDARA
ncbi:MAG TPA: HAD-IB family phosphatase [Aggregatilineaceae bacterium]|nr:HAD-IB family phosphatase [Aggregatilineaceae bacterium]